MKIIFENDADVHLEDNGCAMIAEVSSPDNEVFVRIQSWDDNKHHHELRSMLGDIVDGITKRKIKITIEALDKN